MSLLILNMLFSFGETVYAPYCYNLVLYSIAFIKFVDFANRYLNNNYLVKYNYPILDITIKVIISIILVFIFFKVYQNVDGILEIIINQITSAFLGLLTKMMSVLPRNNASH